MLKFQLSQALTSHFESFWSIVYCVSLHRNQSDSHARFYDPRHELFYKQVFMVCPRSNQTFPAVVFYAFSFLTESNVRYRNTLTHSKSMVH